MHVVEHGDASARRHVTYNAPINVFPDPEECGHIHGHLTFSFFFSCQ